jgi:hypothetical protein
MTQWLAKRKIKRDNKIQAKENMRITEENKQMAVEDTRIAVRGAREHEVRTAEVLMSSDSSQVEILALTSRLRANLLSKTKRHQYERAANKEAISNPTWRLEESSARSAFDAMTSGRPQAPVLKYIGNEADIRHRSATRILPGIDDDSEVSDYDSDTYQAQSHAEDNSDEETFSHEDTVRQPVTQHNPVRLRSCLRTATTVLAGAHRSRTISFASAVASNW